MVLRLMRGKTLNKILCPILWPVCDHCSISGTSFAIFYSASASNFYGAPGIKSVVPKPLSFPEPDFDILRKPTQQLTCAHLFFSVLLFVIFTTLAPARAPAFNGASAVKVLAKSEGYWWNRGVGTLGHKKG